MNQMEPAQVVLLVIQSKELLVLFLTPLKVTHSAKALTPTVNAYNAPADII
jgi:hypothetical protein